MSAVIVLYQYEVSPFCDKIRRILHWKRQPYRVEEIPPSQTFTRVRKINPAGKLPCIEHEGRLIADSTDVALYIEERFPEPPLLPSDPAGRALCHVLEDWADESLYFYEMRLRFTLPHNAARWTPTLLAHESRLLRPLLALFIPRMMRGVTSSQGVGRRPLEVVLRDVERHADAIGGLLGSRSWLVGDALTLADVSVFAQLACIRGTPEGERIVAARPAVAAWMERVDRATARPA